MKRAGVQRLLLLARHSCRQHKHAGQFIAPACTAAGLTDAYNTARGQLQHLKGGYAPQRTFAADAHDGVHHTAHDMDEGTYHKLADSVLDILSDRLELLTEELEWDGCDVEYSQGVLTLRLGHKGTYVINKQSPNRQIWLSSPVSGPLRYDYVNGHWIYKRDGHDMLVRLQQELQELCGRGIDLAPEVLASPVLRH